MAFPVVSLALRLASLLRGVAFCAGILIRMAGQTAAFIEHGELRVASVFERWKWDVRARQLIVAAAAEIRDVAG